MVSSFSVVSSGSSVVVLDELELTDVDEDLVGLVVVFVVDVDRDVLEDN